MTDGDASTPVAVAKRNQISPRTHDGLSLRTQDSLLSNVAAARTFKRGFETFATTSSAAAIYIHGDLMTTPARNLHFTGVTLRDTDRTLAIDLDSDGPDLLATLGYPTPAASSTMASWRGSGSVSRHAIAATTVSPPPPPPGWDEAEDKATPERCVLPCQIRLLRILVADVTAAMTRSNGESVASKPYHPLVQHRLEQLEDYPYLPHWPLWSEQSP